MYVALKMHFDDNNYDYIRYHGKIKAKEASFTKRRDVWQFTKLAKDPNLKNLLLAHHIDAKIGWVGDLLKPEADEIRRGWEKRQESLSYLFTQEIKKLQWDFSDNFTVINGDHPCILKMHMHKEISPETMVILNDLVSFIPKWDRQISDPYVWPAVSRKLRRYKSFLTYDKERYRKITLSHFALRRNNMLGNSKI